MNDTSAEIVPIKKWILVISIVSSLCSVAWSLVVYHRSLRFTFPDKKNLHWKGGILQFLWHFSSISARVIALSLFAAISPKGIGKGNRNVFSNHQMALRSIFKNLVKWQQDLKILLPFDENF